MSAFGLNVLAVGAGAVYMWPSEVSTWWDKEEVREGAGAHHNHNDDDPPDRAFTLWRTRSDQLTSTPRPRKGELVFGMMASLARFESSLIGERVRPGMTRARAEGKRISRPPIPEAKCRRIAELHRAGKSINRIHVVFECGPNAAPVVVPQQTVVVPQQQTLAPNLTYSYRTDEELLAAARTAEAYCATSGTHGVVSSIAPNTDGSKTVVFQCARA